MEEQIVDKLANKMQTITLTLNDGRKITFTGKAFFDQESTEELTIVDIKFSEPIELPEGYYFSELTQENIK